MCTPSTSAATFVGAPSAPLRRVTRTASCARRARGGWRSAPRACAPSDAAQPPAPAPAPNDRLQDGEDAEEKPARTGAEPVPVRAARAVWRVGWLAWWGQLVLTVVAGVILGFAAAFPGSSIAASASAPGLALSFACAACAAVSWAWTYVYTRASLRLAGAAPGALDRVGGALRGGVVLSVVGCAVGLFALQATVGALLARSFTAGAGAGAATAAGGGLVLAPPAVQPVDLLVAQAAVNALCSLFIGLVAALWLQGRVRKWKEEEAVWAVDD